MKKLIMTILCMTMMATSACGGAVKSDKEIAYISFEAEDRDSATDWFTDGEVWANVLDDSDDGTISYSGYPIAINKADISDASNGQVCISNIKGYSSDSYVGYIYIEKNMKGAKIVISNDPTGQSIELLLSMGGKQITYEELANALEDKESFLSLAEPAE